MARHATLAVVVVLAACGGCRLAIPGVVPGTVCDADARTDDAEWWRTAEPLLAMDRVTKALKLKVEASDRASRLREGVESAAEDCKKGYFDGYVAAHATVEKAIGELDAFKLGRPKSDYDPELARRSFSTYCDAAYEMEVFISKMEGCAR
ncbi:MAG: hypothetical protein HY897_19015 [Deltaproteobacteria bacterium]|nr:hypothetical protein [Deltaproteobacteria bacterium]